MQSNQWHPTPKDQPKAKSPNFHVGFDGSVKARHTHLTHKVTVFAALRALGARRVLDERILSALIAIGLALAVVPRRDFGLAVRTVHGRFLRVGFKFHKLSVHHRDIHVKNYFNYFSSTA